MTVIEPVVTLAEAQAFLRIETGDEEALLAGLVRSATAICEAFLDQYLIERSFAVELPASASWQKLSVGPVRSIAGVESLAVDGSAVALPALSYAVDIDASGCGWVRMTAASGTRVRVTGVAGLAALPSDVPEPIRQGVLRLVAHLFSDRDGVGGEPPAAVTALWRPYRRVRLS